MNCTKVATTDLTIALRSNWSYLSQIILSGLGEGNATSSRIIIVKDTALTRLQSQVNHT